MIIITLDTEVFLSLGVGGPWGSGLANIKCVVADILHGAAIILLGMASILSNVPDILHVQHQFFEILLECFGLLKGKNTLFSTLFFF